jgi:hypothetical protein
MSEPFCHSLVIITKLILLYCCVPMKQAGCSSVVVPVVTDEVEYTHVPLPHSLLIVAMLSNNVDV